MRVRGISIRHLLAGSEDRLGLTQVMGGRNLEKCLHRIQVQHDSHGGVRGSLQHHIMMMMNPSKQSPWITPNRKSSLAFHEEIRTAHIPCIFICATERIEGRLRDIYLQTGIPLLASAYDNFLLESRLKGLLREKIAKHIRVHGVLLQIFGLGVLIQGDSGAGKTTIGTMLARRGHTWIADDVIDIRKKRGNRLYAFGIKATRNLIDLKESGILNTQDFLGRCNLAGETDLHLILEIQSGNNILNSETMQNTETFREIMGCHVPYLLISRKREQVSDVLEIERQVKAFGRNRGPLCII